jgi:GT2 family glycosyltransferase
MGRVSIIIVSYNHRDVVGDCLRSLDRAGLDPAGVRILLVDNGSSDGTVDHLRRDVLQDGGSRTPGGLPVELQANGRNLGFAGGNNVALRRALADRDELVYLLNPDAEVAPGFLAAAVAALRGDDRIAFVQSLVLRHGEQETVNTYGNALHFLGFGYAAGDGQRLSDEAVAARLAGPPDIAFPSGAAMLARVAALEALGLFNEEIFLYLEDLELGWRSRLAGWRVIVAPASRVYHKYGFSRGVQKYFWLERNRLLVLGWYYRPGTLLLILPAFVAMELGLWAFALWSGWWREKLRAYRYCLAPARWRSFLATRREVQRRRRIGDREVTALFTSEIVFPALDTPLLTRIANPLFAIYWRLARRLLRW